MIGGFSDIDTLPVINIGSATAEFTSMSVTYGQEAAEAYLATADNSKFYASFGDTIINADGSIECYGDVFSQGTRLPRVYYGTSAPDDGDGEDGDIYIMYS